MEAQALRRRYGRAAKRAFKNKMHKNVLKDFLQWAKERKARGFPKAQRTAAAYHKS